MSNNIEALMADMKAAAEKATPGQWKSFTSIKSGTYAVHTPGDERRGNIINWMGFDGVDGGKRQKAANAKFIGKANPENVLKLIAALEQSQRQNGHIREQSAEWERKAISNFEECSEMSARIDELESQRKLAFMTCNRWRDKCVDAEKYIAELESNKELIGFRCKRSDGLGEWHYAYHREPDDFDLKHQIIEQLYAVPRADAALCVKSDAMREVAPLCVKLPAGTRVNGFQMLVESEVVAYLRAAGIDAEVFRTAGGNVEGG